MKNQFKITPPRTAAGRPTRTAAKHRGQDDNDQHEQRRGREWKRVAIFHEYSGQRRQPEHDHSRADDLPSHRHTARYRRQARSRLHGMVLGDDIRGLSSRM